MKTSNKLLLGAFIAGLICTFCLFGFIRANSVIESAAGEANSSDYTRTDLSGFDKIEIRGTVRAYLVPSDEAYLEAHAVNDQAGKMSQEVHDGTLELNFEYDSKYKGNAVPKVRIGMGGVNSLHVAESGEAVSADKILVEQFEIAVEHGADVHLEMEAKAINVDLTAGSDLVLRGTADRLALTCNSAGDLNAKRFKVKDLVLKVTDACDVDISVSGTATGSVAAAADVNCYGCPQSDVKVSGAADFDIRSSKN